MIVQIFTIKIMYTLHTTSQATLSPYYAFYIIFSIASWRHVIYFLSNLSWTTPVICHLPLVKSVISPNINMGSLGLDGGIHCLQQQRHWCDWGQPKEWLCWHPFFWLLVCTSIFSSSLLATQCWHLFAFFPWRDFLLQQELLQAISDLSSEHPSEAMFVIFIVPSLHHAHFC